MVDTILQIFETDWFTRSEVWLLTYVLHSSVLLFSAWVITAFKIIRSDQLRELVWKFALVGGLITASIQTTFDIRSVSGNFAFPWVSRVFVPGIDKTEGEFIESTEVKSHVKNVVVVDDDVPAQNSKTPFLLSDEPINTQVDLFADDSSALTSFADVAEEPESRTVSDTTFIDPRTGSGLVRVEKSGKRDGYEPIILADNDAGLVREYKNLVLLSLGISLGLFLVYRLIRVFAVWMRVTNCLSNRQEITGGVCYELLSGLCKRGGIGRTIRLSQTAEINVPIAFGVFNPEICIPVRAISGLSVSQQEIMLAHELAHIVRHDPAWFAVGHAIDKILFIQPLNRLARRRIQEASEYASDSWAVNITGCSLTLAKCLTEVAGWFTATSTQAGSLISKAPIAAMAQKHTILSKRISRLLDDSQDDIPVKTLWWYRWRYLFIMFIAAFLMAVVPGITPGQSTTDNEIDDAEPDTIKTHSGNNIITNHEADDSGNIRRAIQQFNEEMELLEIELEALKTQVNDSGLVTDDLLEIINLIEVKIGEIRERRLLLLNYEKNISWPEMFTDEADQASDNLLTKKR